MVEGDNEPTTGELARRFDRLDNSIESGFRRLDERLDKMVTTDVFTISQQSNETRIAQLGSAMAALEQKGADAHRQRQNEINEVRASRDKDRRAAMTALGGAGVSLVVGVVGWLVDLLGTTPLGP